MNMAVCVKQVPDTSDLRINPETNTLMREGVQSVLNPLDEFPLETALRLKEASGGSVTVFTMGPPQAEAVLTKAMAMGADKAVLVSDRDFAGADTWATSLTLARALETAGPFDLILCGKQAVDGDTAQVGPGIAAHLRIPQITYVTTVESAGNNMLHVKRLNDQGTVLIEVSTPALLTVLKEANEPRLPTLSGRLHAMETPIMRMGARSIGLDAAAVGLAGSPTRVVEIGVPQACRKHLRIEGAASDCASQLLAELRRSQALKEHAFKTQAEDTTDGRK